jgi:hypothetical protein
LLTRAHPCRSSRSADSDLGVHAPPSREGESEAENEAKNEAEAEAEDEAESKCECE